MQIGLFFGSTTCYTEMAAEKIQQIIGEDLSLPILKTNRLKMLNNLILFFLVFQLGTLVNYKKLGIHLGRYRQC